MGSIGIQTACRVHLLHDPRALSANWQLEQQVTRVPGESGGRKGPEAGALPCSQRRLPGGGVTPELCFQGGEGIGQVHDMDEGPRQGEGLHPPAGAEGPHAR